MEDNKNFESFQKEFEEAAETGDIQTLKRLYALCGPRLHIVRALYIYWNKQMEEKKVDRVNCTVENFIKAIAQDVKIPIYPAFIKHNAEMFDLNDVKKIYEYGRASKKEFMDAAFHMRDSDENVIRYLVEVVGVPTSGFAWHYEPRTSQFRQEMIKKSNNMEMLHRVAHVVNRRNETHELMFVRDIMQNLLEFIVETKNNTPINKDDRQCHTSSIGSRSFDAILKSDYQKAAEKRQRRTFRFRG